MSLQVEKLEHNMAKLTVEVAAEDVEKALQAAYLKERSKISLPHIDFAADFENLGRFAGELAGNIGNRPHLVDEVLLVASQLGGERQ